jgi:hypothetical protein
MSTVKVLERATAQAAGLTNRWSFFAAARAAANFLVKEPSAAVGANR